MLDLTQPVVTMKQLRAQDPQLAEQVRRRIAADINEAAARVQRTLNEQVKARKAKEEEPVPDQPWR